MENLRSLLLCMTSMLCFIAASGYLRAGGKNVKTTYQYYYTTELTSARVRKTRRTCTQTCATHFWWCWKKDTVCRTIVYYQWGYAYKSVRRTRPVYTCKTGWKRKGSECTIPICTGGCQNHGVCTKPNICQCKPGWTGSRCRSDINECKTSQNKCGYKPGCRNTPGSYRCTCSVGYYLNSDQRSCTDINECTTGRHTCGPNTKCLNTPGSYNCPCINGFTFNTTAGLCEDIDECNPSSGVVHGCQMNCNNFFGSYNCSCDKGFYLISNGKGCLDHDECAGNMHGCEQRCLNLPGGYNCTCVVGYRLNTMNFKTCDDINECSKGISGCAQECNNTIGSFSCSCKQGYLLGKDLKSCNDIDECSKPVDYCHQVCLNTAGSYRCSCRPGFDLLFDRKTCQGRPCFPVYNPIDGMMNCSGFRTEDSCKFECLPGYDLHGSRNRTCAPNKQWTGNETVCRIIHCASPADPSNGFIYSPCTTHYGSQCSVGCNQGYYTEDNSLGCDANGIWQPDNVSCIEIKVCEPNPCLHGGLCSVVSEDHYTCHCAHTGYMGTNCDVGFFTIPEYPTITKNVLSPPIMIHASPPRDYVVLNLVSRELEFSSSRLVFKRGASLNQSIRIAARDAGIFFIRYSLSGSNAGEFYLPEHDILFVKSGNNSTEEDESILSFPQGCHKKQLRICSRSNNSIIVSSTSPFVSFGPLTITNGIVSIEFANYSKTPLSLVGINLPDSNVISVPQYCEDSDVASYSMESLLKSRVLTKSFIDAVTESFPTWMKVTLSEHDSVRKDYASELKTHFLTGKELREEDVGEGQPVVDDAFYSLLVTKNLNFTIQDDIDIFKSNTLSLAVELCGLSPLNVFLRPSLHENLNSLKNLSILKELEKYGWDLKLYSLQFSKTNTIARPKKGYLWDGYHLFNVEDSSDGSFSVVSSFNKYFRNSDFADMMLEFEGTMIGNVKDIDKILDSPLDQFWDIDLYGRIALTLVLKVEGESVKLCLNGQESVGYATFGGNIDEVLPMRRRGLFFSSVLEKNPFLNSVLGKFVEISSDKSILCSQNTTMYKEKHHHRHIEVTDSFSCVFRGNLKFGALRFDSLNVSLFMGNLINSSSAAYNSTSLLKHSVELLGTYTKLESATFGIFKRSPESPLSVRVYLAQNRSESTASFLAISNILGIEKVVNVSISYQGLSFQVSGKMHDLYDASMTCLSSLLSWEGQVFDVEGRFETNSGATLLSSLKREIDSYAVNVFLRAVKRVEGADQAVERAYVRLENVLLLKRQAVSKLQQIAYEHSLTKKNLESAQQYLAWLENGARNYSKEVEKLKSDLSGLCQIKQCPDVCQEGISCTACYQDIIGEKRGMCPATCSRTIQRAIPPFSEIVLCGREKCKRIHNTNGIFKTLLGKTFGGIVKSVLSFGISSLATFFGAPPPVSSALGNGIVTFLDTGRVDEALCSFTKEIGTGFIGGPGLSKVFKKFSKVSRSLAVEKIAVSLGRKAAAGVVGKLISCQREQRDGYWKCRVEKVECTKGRYEYKYENFPYLCEKSCVVETIEKTIEKSCCKNVSCASFILNISCLAENIFCKKSRMDAMEKISNSTSQAGKLLKSLEMARSNASYWKMKERKEYYKLMSARRWFNSTNTAARSLEKSYNGTIESREEVKKLHSKPLRMKLFLNAQLTSTEGIKLEEVHFKTKVFARNSDTLLPIDITFQVNGTTTVMSTVLDFDNFNTSLKSIAKEILTSIIGKTHSSSRKKRSIKTASLESDKVLSSLKKYHSYCAKFTNYHQILHNVASSLYNLSSEILFLHQTLSQVKDSFSNISNEIQTSNFTLNRTIASKFGLTGRKYVYSSLENLDYDLEMSEAMELQQEQIQQRYEAPNYSTNLLVYNWYAMMEDMFNSTSFDYACSGMNDCITQILDDLLQLFAIIEADGVDRSREHIKTLENALKDLSDPVDVTINKAAEISSYILNILAEMTKLKVVCAQSPNITIHPRSFTELGIGKLLVLHCNATGTTLQYSWTFNGKVLENQKSNVLTIFNTTISISGNYTCEVSNHIAKEKSTPAVVIIHPPPIITIQPAEYLAVVLTDDDSLLCKVKNSGGNISYRWWFRYPNSSSSFMPLNNETFSYLNFAPMKIEHEGWYYCEVSNLYGVTTSRISFVKPLSFTIPVPMVILSISILRRTQKTNSSTFSFTKSAYHDLSSRILTLLLSHQNLSKGMSIEDLQPSNCRLRISKNNNTRGTVEVCSWQFQYTGRNMTSNLSIYDNFEVSAGKVINATSELQERVGDLVNATNNGSLSFSMAGGVYLAERNSISVQKFSLMCPRTQKLVQEDFKCVDCPPGYYAELGKDHMAKCKPCSLGFYQSEPGKSICQRCPKGFTTRHEGAHEHAQCTVICKAGQYGTVKEATGYCIPCPLNEFQPREGQTACLPCPKNYITHAKGASDSTQCVLVICKAGQYGTVKEGTRYCIPCPLNEFQPREGQTACLPCPTNHITHEEGASDVKQCVLEETVLPSKPMPMTDAASFSTTRTKILEYDKIHQDESDESDKIVSIAVPLGVLFLIFLVIGIAIFFWRRKRSREYKVNSETVNELEIKRISENWQYNPTYTSANGSTFSNPIYDDASCLRASAATRNLDAFSDQSHIDSRSVKCDDKNVKQTYTTSSSSFCNPLFQKDLDEENQ